ncbi:MAG TPA: peptidylprolyl isomerase, partial [Quisquiliibacterium sp.]|nr:peptidylprolyl isomerase [Quisquiliibacterium sp.]
EIVVELYPDKAPKTVENFLQYVRDGHYDGTIFHRVIGNFMIQGGGFTADFYKPGTPDFGQKKTRAPITLESKNGLRNDAGWIAMARTSQPNSATAQFFINTVDNANLNHPQPDGFGYAVFGKVVKGMEAVNAIRAVKTGRMGPFGDVPADPVTIDSVTVVGAR